MASPNNGIVYYHYSASPFGKRVLWYLALRGIDYAEVKQPIVMPRPDLEAIGVKYRRIPVMAIGKDVYCDTRLIIARLEKMFPQGALGATQPDQIAVQKLLEVWCIEGGMFVRASQLLPITLPMMKDPKFLKDREQFSGRPWKPDVIEANRPEALQHIKNGFQFLESTLLADDREWILRTETPSLADIEAVWVFDWLNGLPGALPKHLISKTQFPKVYAWMARFNQAVKAAKDKAPRPSTLKGTEAAQRIFDATVIDSAGNVDPADPTGLQQDTLVQIWPVDSGFSHKDQGRLVALNDNEIVIGLENGLQLHAPRVGFRIRRVTQDKQAKL